MLLRKDNSSLTHRIWTDMKFKIQPIFIIAGREIKDTMRDWRFHVSLSWQIMLPSKVCNILTVMEHR